MNTLLIVLWSVLVALCLIFVLGAIFSAYRRNVIESLTEVFQSMVIEPVFDSFVITAGTLAAQGRYLEMSAAFAAFIGYKAVATGVVVSKSGDYRYQFFTTKKLNKLAAFIISTKTWAALAGIGVIWYAGYKEFIDPGRVSLEIIPMVSAWMVANGYSSIATLMQSKKDWSFLNPTVVKPAPVEEVETEISGPIPTPEKPAVIVVEKPKYPNRPEYIPFNSKIWDEEFKSYFKTNPLQDSDQGRNDATKIESIAYGKAVWYIQQLVDFANWRIEKFYKEFEEDFGFPFHETEKHWGDANLVGSCPATSENTFLFKIEHGLKEVYQEMATEEARYNYFAMNYNSFDKSVLEAALATGKYDYMEAYEMMWRHPEGLKP